MHLSRKTDYALRAIFHLAACADAQIPVSIREIAVANDVPRRFLENIMLEMKEAGWVRSLPGRDGGYLLAKSPDQLTMGEVVRHFDGVLAPIGCVSVNHYLPCSQEPRCRFRRILLEIRNYTAKLMDSATISSMMNETPVSRGEVFEDAMVGGLGI